MVKIKTSDLKGATLDWAVAKAVNQVVKINNAISYMGTVPDGPAFIERYQEEPWPGADDGYMKYSPSCKWSQGGLLIEKYSVAILKQKSYFSALAWRKDGKSGDGDAETHLIAAMRAIVAAELGDTVDVPKELL